MFLISESFFETLNTEHKGRGIFAKKTIGRGTVISDYLGQVIKTANYDLDQDKNGLYLMYYSDQACIYPDLKTPGPHLINHSCQPNCSMYIYKGHTLFFANKTINPGDELTISYQLSPNECGENCVHECKCGDEKCTGTMHLSLFEYEQSQKKNQVISRKTRKAKVSFGKNLPPLSSYPDKL